MSSPITGIGWTMAALAASAPGALGDTVRRAVHDTARRQEIVVKAMAVGMTDVEQLLVERPDEDVHFLYKAPSRC